MHGVAFGGGFQLMLGADMRFIAPDTKLSLPSTQIKTLDHQICKRVVESHFRCKCCRPDRFGIGCFACKWIDPPIKGLVWCHLQHASEGAEVAREVIDHVLSKVLSD